jgi:hypothetical protein
MIMTKYVNVYPGILVLPNGDEVAKGATVDLSSKDAENFGVQEWLSKGYLVKPGDAPKAAPTEDTKALHAEIERLTAALSKANTEMEAVAKANNEGSAELAKVAKERDDAVASVASLTAELETAKKAKA